jgi:maleate isomerase
MTRVGMVIPSANTATETLIQAVLQGRPAVHFARMRLTEGTKEAEDIMLRDHLPGALEDLRTAGIDVLVLACTSGTSFGDDAARDVFEEQAKQTSGAREVLTASGLASSAMRRRGWKSIALLTPYLDALGEHVAAALHADGFEVAVSHHLGYRDARSIGEIPEEKIITAIDEVASTSQECDGIFVSCNNLALPTVSSGYISHGLETLTSNGVIAEAISEHA